MMGAVRPAPASRPTARETPLKRCTAAGRGLARKGQLMPQVAGAQTAIDAADGRSNSNCRRRPLALKGYRSR